VTLSICWPFCNEFSCDASVQPRHVEIISCRLVAGVLQFHAEVGRRIRQGDGAVGRQRKCESVGRLVVQHRRQAGESIGQVRERFLVVGGRHCGGKFTAGGAQSAQESLSGMDRSPKMRSRRRCRQDLAVVDGAGGVLHQVREVGTQFLKTVGQVGVADWPAETAALAIAVAPGTSTVTVIGNVSVKGDPTGP